MLSWFQAIMPKEGRFYDLFEQHAQTLCAGAQSLNKLLEGGPAVPEHSMDDAIDQMHKTAKVTALFDQRSFQPDMLSLGGVIVRTAALTAEAVPLLRSMKGNAARLNQITDEVTRLEEESDHLYDSGIAALYRDVGKSDPMAYIVGAEIYDHLEKVVDRFEDVANRISGVLIEHL